MKTDTWQPTYVTKRVSIFHIHTGVAASRTYASKNVTCHVGPAQSTLVLAILTKGAVVTLCNDEL